jgi:hypothetical protein
MEVRNGNSVLYSQSELQAQGKEELDKLLKKLLDNMKLLFATQNRGKLREVKEILNSSSIEVLSLIGLEDIPK